MTRFLLIQHEDNCSPDYFGQWWREASVKADILHGKTDPLPEQLPADVDALVVFGGGMNCNSDAENPWLPGTRALIAQAVEQGIPFLGICLGHQLATVALGGAVAPKDAPTIGLTEIGVLEAGYEDVLFQVVAPGARQVQYNYDAVTQLPEGAVVLAASPEDSHIQAVRFAPLAWGVQFHPECSPATFDGWTVDKDEDKQPQIPGERSLEELAEEIHGAETTTVQTSRALAMQFLQIAKAVQEQRA